MRINDLLVESTIQDEGIGSALGGAVGLAGKALGAIPGAVHGAWDSAKAGYQAGRAAAGPGKTLKQGVRSLYKDGFTDGSDASNNPSAGGASAGAGSSAQDPVQLRKQGQQLIAQADTIEKQQRQASSTQSSNTSGDTNNTQATQQGASVPQNPLDNKRLLVSMQNLKGADVEKIRNMLKAKAGVKEGQELEGINLGAVAAGARRAGAAALSGIKKAGSAAVAGAKIAAPYVKKGAQMVGKGIAATPGAIAKAAGATSYNVRQGWQSSGGASMTTQSIGALIAQMTPQQAAQILQWYEGVHAPTGATSGSTTTPATNTPTTPPTEPPEDDNPNIVRGYNESKVIKFRSNFLGMDI